MLKLLGLLIITFGLINIVRMTMFILASNIYDIKKAKHENRYKHALLRQNIVRTTSGVMGHLLVLLMRGCRNLLLRINGEFYEIKPVKIAQRVKSNNDRYRPLVSVVVPAHNEERVILRNIKSILASSYKKLEIIVADDGSTDRTNALVKSFKRERKVKNLYILHRPNRGKSSALNYAIKHRAKGKLVMCLDADSMVLPDSIANGVRCFKDRQLEALSSNVKIIDDGSMLSLIQKFEYLVCYQMKKSQSVLNIEYIIGGIGSMFRASALRKVNYYDTDTMTEDIDLTMKLIRRGSKTHKVAYAADMIALTESVRTIPDLIKQRYRWKYGRLQTLLKNRHMFFNRSAKHYKALTWAYLPYAIFGELAFFFEPMLIVFMLTASIVYTDVFTFYSAYVVITGYLAINIWGDEYTSGWKKAQLIAIAPTMYLLFFVLSFVEYAALVKSLASLPQLKQSLKKRGGQWGHVERSGVAV